MSKLSNTQIRKAREALVWIFVALALNQYVCKAEIRQLLIDVGVSDNLPESEIYLSFSKNGRQVIQSRMDSNEMYFISAMAALNNPHVPAERKEDWTMPTVATPFNFYIIYIHIKNILCF